MNLLNYRLTTRIAASFAIMVALIIALGTTAIVSSHAIDAQVRALIDAGTADASAPIRDAARTALQHSVDHMQTVMLVSMVVAVALGVWLGWAVRRSIRGPVENLVASVTRIAAGDLATKISSSGRDEIAWLNHELNQMRKKLQATITDVRTSAEQVASASGEIASGNSDLSARTESQAGSLQQTASSMEELTSTVRQNADSARQANQLVAGTSEVATRGSQVMNAAVTTMNDIHESARRISDIIGVIDGIAFQTNILALNAAVEAARAGEQGRGFAVVASEVRSLAQRSASAAREIKTLIDDSVGKVDAGTRLVNQAGTTMQEILASVRQVTDIMGEISAASQEQSSGIEQVNRAIESMDGATQQNAALVEESAAAAHSLKEQSARLHEVVKVFRVDASA